MAKKKKIHRTNHIETVVYDTFTCNFCELEGITTEAKYDGKTTYGSWAEMCEKHFNLYGMGLGLGLGQKLIKERMK